MGLRAGTKTTNHLTGAEWEILEAEAETGGTGLFLKVRCRPGAPPDVLVHWHETWEEEFEILEGTARYVENGQERTVAAGETIRYTPGNTHIHPWNGGDGDLVYTQRARWPVPNQTAARETFGVFFTLFDMAADPARLTKRGLPKDPLQFAVMGRTLNRYGNWDGAVPKLVQILAGATAGRLAGLLGYQAISEKYRD